MARPAFRITFKDQGIFRSAPAILWVPTIWSPFPGGCRETPRTALSVSEILNKETAENQSDPN